MHRSWPNQGTASTWRCLSGSDDRWEVAHPQPLSRPQHHQHSTKPIALGLYPSSWANWSQGNLSGNSTGKKRRTKWTQISNSTKRCYPDKRVENAFHSQTHMSEKNDWIGNQGAKAPLPPSLGQGRPSGKHDLLRWFLLFILGGGVHRTLKYHDVISKKLPYFPLPLLLPRALSPLWNHKLGFINSQVRQEIKVVVVRDFKTSLLPYLEIKWKFFNVYLSTIVI